MESRWHTPLDAGMKSDDGDPLLLFAHPLVQIASSKLGRKPQGLSDSRAIQLAGCCRSDQLANVQRVLDAGRAGDCR